jgi:hypothetical protein
MIAPTEITTATLAAVFGLALVATNASRERETKPDQRAVRELAVLSRVLEKRLAETRKSLSIERSPIVNGGDAAVEGTECLAAI